GNAFAVLEPVDAAETRDVEQHAAPHHLVLGMLDAQHVQPLGVDELGVIAVVGLVLVEDVPERIPVRGPLHAQVQRVVGVADLVPVLPAGDGVGAGRQHLMDRIEASSEQAGLRAVAVERDADGKHLAGADRPGGRSASVTAYMIAPGAPAVPASPAPFAPSSESPVGVTTWPTSMSGISAAIGTR